MDLETFKSVKAEGEEDAKVPDNLNAILEKRIYLPSLIQKWVDYYSKQQYIVSQLELKKQELFAKLEYEYKFKKNIAYDGKFLTDSVMGDPEYTKLCLNIEQQKYMLNEIRGTLDNLKGVGFAIKDYLDYKYGQKYGM